jgi:hypothetical protein
MRSALSGLAVSLSVSNASLARLQASLDGSRLGSIGEGWSWGL